MRNCVVISFFAIALITTAASKECSKCVKTDACPVYGKLSPAAQEAWQNKYPCTASSSSSDEEDSSKLYGFSPVAKGDYVCCSDEAQGLIIRPNNNNYGRSNKNNGYNYPNAQTPNSYNYGNSRPNGNGWGSDNTNSYPNQDSPSSGSASVENQRPPKNYFNSNNNPYVTPNPFFHVNQHGNAGYANQAQCPITSFPPKLQSGCCGREASDTDRIIVTTTTTPAPSDYDSSPENSGDTNPGSSLDNPAWPSWSPNYNNPSLRVARSAEVTPAPPVLSVGNRIIGGRETGFEQFPWTALLDITFDYGNRRQAFNCGGSLISNRYILTAGHCVYDKGGKVVDLEVYLAEYDKRTFPIDCKIVDGRKKCIKNVLMKGEDFVLHPQYNDENLNNDIALIRLRGNAPYTNYIRPICLPSINIDNPEFANIRLAVAGWGRDGRYRSDIKQSTIVNLVPQAKCKKFYPSLSRRQMCAAGYTGEDTCKGDSGGPLMTVYGGKYEVVGVVSGKRADSPCGTSVPSLYTNVYHYNEWIRNNIRP